MPTKTETKTETSVLLTGQIHVYGPPGSGKTLFALTASTNPDKIVFLDGDSRKGYHLAREFGIEQYRDLASMAAGVDEVTFFSQMLDFVDRLPDGNELIVWDNPFALLRGAHSLVRTHRTDFRKVWAPKGEISGGQEWQEARKILLPGLYAKLQQKADLVVFCTHEKAQSLEGVKTGLMEPEGKKEFRTSSGMVIRLGRNTRNPTDPAPVGLLIKRPLPKVSRGSRKITDIFPERISPCDWEKIAHYIDNPVGDRTDGLTPEETPDDFEYNLITGTLNPEQRKMFEWRKQMAALQAEEGLPEDVLALVAEKADMPPAFLYRTVANELNGRYPALTPERVEQIVAGSTEQEQSNGEKDEQA